MEYERVKSEIAFRIGVKLSQGCGGTELCEQHNSCEECIATQILSLVEIKSDNQSLPKNPYNEFLMDSDPKVNTETLKHKVYSKAQQDMLKANFIRVIPKPKRRGK